MASLLDAKALMHLQDASVERWHQGPIVHDQREPLLKEVLLNHAHNFELWHEEDKARDQKADDAIIAQVKRNIDRFNQERNNAMERIDEMVLALLTGMKGEPDERLPLHSETVGSIVDRLSILSLKVFHMREQTLREDADETHRESCIQKLNILKQQQSDLAEALQRLLEELESGTKRFRVYRQMKMYNDPALNPVLYKEGE